MTIVLIIAIIFIDTLYWYIGTFIAGLCSQEKINPLWVILFWPWYLNLAKKCLPW